MTQATTMMAPNGPGTFVRGDTSYWEYPCGCRASALVLTSCSTHSGERLGEARETIARLNRRCQSAEAGLLAKSTSMRFKSAIENALRSQLEDQRRRASEETARLQSALAPLASLLRECMDERPDDAPLYSTAGVDGEGRITVGDLRRAKALTNP